jgi:hypothetical protein
VLNESAVNFVESADVVRSSRKYNLSATVVTLLLSSALFRQTYNTAPPTTAILAHTRNLEITTKKSDGNHLGKTNGILRSEENVPNFRRVFNDAVLTVDSI